MLDVYILLALSVSLSLILTSGFIIAFIWVFFWRLLPLVETTLRDLQPGFGVAYYAEEDK